MALNSAEASFLAQKVGGDSNYWPDHEKHVHHIMMPRVDADNYLYNDSSGVCRITDHVGLLSFYGRHQDGIESRVYIYTATDSGESPTINDPEGHIIAGLGE